MPEATQPFKDPVSSSHFAAAWSLESDCPNIATSQRFSDKRYVMLDAKALQKVRLSHVPIGQKIVAWTLLWPNYSLPPKTEIVVEGLENIPDKSVFLAMNHTDRYNYWPFQYALYRQGIGRFTATWVKGKYYENPWVSRFMMSMNTIPVPSRGYIIASRFREFVGHAPNEDEYRVLRDLVDGRNAPEAIERTLDKSSDLFRFFEGYTSAHADRHHASTVERAYLHFESEFEAVMAEVVRLNREALQVHDCHVLVFPEGTRSRTLNRGHTGMVQLAQHLNTAIVPVGCSGSDQIYPGNSPIARGGRVVYRIGEALEPDGQVLGELRIREPFVPLTRDATNKYRERFQAITDRVMAKIAGLVEARYLQATASGADPRRPNSFL